MKIRLLSTALLAGLAFAQAANAQDFDDRWYLTGSAGFNVQDGDRGTTNAPFGVGLGLGRFISDNWSLDGELNYQNPHNDGNHDLNWSQYGVSVDLRRHFMVDGRNWSPYALMGWATSAKKSKVDNFPEPHSPGDKRTATWPPSSASASRAIWAASATAPNWPTARSPSTTRAALQSDDPFPEKMTAKTGTATSWPRWGSSFRWVRNRSKPLRRRGPRAAPTWTATATA